LECLGIVESSIAPARRRSFIQIFELPRSLPSVGSTYGDHSRRHVMANLTKV